MTSTRILVGPASIPDTVVVIGRGLIERDPIVPSRDGRRAVALVTQPGRPQTMAELISARLRDDGLRTVVLVLEDRDRAKTLSQLDSAYSGLHDFGLTRLDTIVAVGGGAATDVGGFLAATYLRGIESVYVSTTLLGAVDASIGGKTGINHGAKNMVGAFWHPRRVLIDLDVLDALPEPVLREGFAEAVKTGFIGDPAIVDLCEMHGLDAPLDEIVPRSVRVKSDVVSSDFREDSSRAFLNYGHTIGHAVEVAAGMTHGHAVGVGMIAASAVSESLREFADRRRHDAVVATLGLPTSAPGLTAAAAAKLIGSDKKQDSTGTRMVLLDRIGAPVLVPVSDADVATGLRAIGIDA